MKPSSGRASSVAKPVTTRAATRAAPRAAAVLTLMALSLPACFLPVGQAHAQVSTATSDGTPLVDSAIEQKDWASALTQLDARLKTNPQDVQAKFKRGTVLARLNRDDDAIAAFTELTQAYPELPEPYNNLAALYAKEGRYEDARAALETATKANPNYALAYDNLGDLYLRLAGLAYQRAQSLGSTSPVSRQRASGIKNILTPPPKSAAATSAATPVVRSPAPYSQAVPVMTMPSFSSPFGGPSGPLPTTPYVAPSTQP